MFLSFGLLINAMDYYINGNLQTSAKKIPSYEMAGELLDSFLTLDYYADEEQQIYVNKFVNCHRQVPKEVKKSCKNNEYNEAKVIATIKDIFKWCDEDNKLPLVNYLLNIVDNDQRIENDFELCDEITKGNFKSFNSIIPELVIFNTLKYAIKSTNNNDLAKECLSQEVNNNFKYPNDFFKEIDGYEEILKLSTTVRNDDFKTLFNPLTIDNELSSEKRKKACLYYLKPEYSGFDLSGLAEFIDDNICEYALSRIEYQDYDPIRLKKMSRDVRHKIIATGMDNHEIIDEVILYYILEKNLKAPKVMTRLEFIEGINKPQSTSVHILKISSNSYELIMAVPMSDEKFINSINTVFDKIELILSNKKDEYEYISKLNNHNSVLEPKDTKLLTDILLKKAHTANVDLAFSIYIGYTYKDTIATDTSFTKRFEAQLKQDMKNIIEEIDNKIKTLHIPNFSYYIYVIPFNNIIDDYKSMLEVQDL